MARADIAIPGNRNVAQKVAKHRCKCPSAPKVHLLGHIADLLV